jgi:formylmethanofuran dehydrogenase subunit B
LAAQGQISGVKDSIQTLGSGLAVALGNVNQNVLVTAAQTAAAITADGDRTRSLITNQYEATLNRQLTEANLRLEGVERARGHDAINMRIDNSNTVTQAQAQTQMQFQMQQQGQLLNGLYPYILGTHQHAQATNANIIAGNTGAVTTGAQTSTPTNVNAR